MQLRVPHVNETERHQCYSTDRQNSQTDSESMALEIDLMVASGSRSVGGKVKVAQTHFLQWLEKSAWPGCVCVCVGGNQCTLLVVWIGDSADLWSLGRESHSRGKTGSAFRAKQKGMLITQWVFCLQPLKRPWAKTLNFSHILTQCQFYNNNQFFLQAPKRTWANPVNFFTNNVNFSHILTQCKFYNNSETWW